ncbi:MAG: hypothetical protein TU35_006895 [Thermoproteus sp. AZ2]|uniref:Uncharacterized protein n=1 Tax=Thermoproteus sp. AZ2 TaxID=1609232 RepID=A0ACC6V1Y6_9CREN
MRRAALAVLMLTALALAAAPPAYISSVSAQLVSGSAASVTVQLSIAVTANEPGPYYVVVGYAGSQTTLGPTQGGALTATLTMPESTSQIEITLLDSSGAQLGSIALEGLCFFTCTTCSARPMILSSGASPSAASVGQPVYISEVYSSGGLWQFSLGASIGGYSASTYFTLKLNTNNAYTVAETFGPFTLSQPGNYTYNVWGSEAGSAGGVVTISGSSPTSSTSSTSPGLIYVKVVNAFNGSAVPAYIRVLKGNTALYTEYSSSLSAVVPPGSYEVAVTAYGYTWSEAVQVYSGQYANVTVQIPIALVSAQAINEAAGSPGPWAIAIYGPGGEVAEGNGSVSAYVLAQYPNGTPISYSAVAYTPFGQYSKSFTVQSASATVDVVVPTAAVTITAVDRASGSVKPWPIAVYGPGGLAAEGLGQFTAYLAPGEYQVLVNVSLGGLSYAYSTTASVSGPGPLQIVVPTTTLKVISSFANGSGAPAEIEVLYGGEPIYYVQGPIASLEVISGLTYIVRASYGNATNATAVTPSGASEEVVLTLPQPQAASAAATTTTNTTAAGAPTSTTPSASSATSSTSPTTTSAAPSTTTTAITSASSTTSTAGVASEQTYTQSNAQSTTQRSTTTIAVPIGAKVALLVDVAVLLVIAAVMVILVVLLLRR